MSEKNKETTSRKKAIWKKLRGFLAMVMVAVISIAGTLAYLSRKTDPITNTFTATTDIDVELDEPEFDPDDAENYQPGVVYPKNPRLTNTTEGTSKDGEWVVIRVDYVVETGKGSKEYTPWTYDAITSDTADAKGLINFNAMTLVGEEETYIDKNIITSGDYKVSSSKGIQTAPDSDWILVKEEWLSDDVKTAVGSTYKSQYYVYKYQLVPGKTDSVATSGSNGSMTAPLFKNVVIKEQATLMTNGYQTAVKDEEGNEVKDEEGNTKYQLSDLPGFDIVVVGGAIKNSGDTTVTIEDGVLDPEKVKDTTSKENNIVNQLVKLLAAENPTLNKS